MVDRTHDLFEIFPDGSALWRGAAVCHGDAIRKLQELAAAATNEMRLMQLQTNTVIATINAPKF
jgi:hypothetical protein